MNIREQVILAPLTTFKIGGAARYFTEVLSERDLSIALDYVETRKIPFCILAGGSNVLFADNGFDGLVIHIEMRAIDIHVHEQTVTTGAGAVLMNVVEEASRAGLIGMETLYGIPGSVGGAVRGNAGAFGTEMKDVVREVRAINIETREIKTFNVSECQFGYRSSFFKMTKEWIIISVVFELALGDAEESLDHAYAILEQRNKRQVQDICSAGSFFMNPVVHEPLQKLFYDEKKAIAKGGRVPAGWLIEKSGFQGVSENGISTGKQSANYIINDGKGTAEDVLALTQKIKEKVYEDFGVELKEEVTVLV